MVQIIRITMKEETVAGLACNVIRPIVIFGEKLSMDEIEKLHISLSDAKQLYKDGENPVSYSDIIRIVCDDILPGRWDFAADSVSIVF